MADNRYRITERVAAGGMAEVFRGVAESTAGLQEEHRDQAHPARR